ncbi:MAG: hypothetical protein JWO65_642 [Sphingomonas bacterium]|jgi:hypothetical protein|nr:hypothetical protein [Sphingomonas bacterium]
MSRALIVITAPLFALLAATPALAVSGSAISVPEPTDALLFVMGVAGVAIGRRMHARAARRDKMRDKTNDKQD